MAGDRGAVDWWNVDRLPAPDPAGKPPPSMLGAIIQLVCVVAGLTIGRVAADHFAPGTPGGGFNFVELALAGGGGAVGGAIGAFVGWVIGRFRR